MRRSLTLQALTERVLLNWLSLFVAYNLLLIINDDQLIIKLQVPKRILFNIVVFFLKFITNYQLIQKITISGKEE